MKLEEAQKLIGYIVKWQFILNGVFKREDLKETIDLTKYSLLDLIKANNLVKGNNTRKEKMQRYHSEKGHKQKGISISMVLSDRSIAAVYTALHFSANGEMVTLINDIGVGCVKANYN